MIIFKKSCIIGAQQCKSVLFQASYPLVPLAGEYTQNPPFTLGFHWPQEMKGAASQKLKIKKKK